jgi:hypothetical protein
VAQPRRRPLCRGRELRSERTSRDGEASRAARGGSSGARRAAKSSTSVSRPWFHVNEPGESGGVAGAIELARNRSLGLTNADLTASLSARSEEFRLRWGSLRVGYSGPRSQVNSYAVDAMRERGIDISGEFPKPWTEEVVRAADVWSLWAAVTPARSTPASGTWAGSSTTAGSPSKTYRPFRDGTERRVRVRGCAGARVRGCAGARASRLVGPVGDRLSHAVFAGSRA